MKLEELERYMRFLENNRDILGQKMRVDDMLEALENMVKEIRDRGLLGEEKKRILDEGMIWKHCSDEELNKLREFNREFYNAQNPNKNVKYHKQEAKDFNLENMSMEIPEVILSSKAIREMLTERINEFIRIEKSENDGKYHVKSSFVRGQINVITTLLDETWDYKESGQSYFDFLKYLVNKYQLEGVWRIKELS
ncbi:MULTISPECIES: hypothetical protein [Bacillus cereus group]|uniref:Uncharacterized protein n=5 Tax=Bacillus cereus group TaxID=86661 RepID=A0AAP4V520_BACTU|nr:MULTISPECIES: hypothetical protein [Bacillus cereus group]EOP80617.1 hypothetical protein IES_06403 [Bacillus cereus BMG1.7]AEA19294.1 hypothetical protein CT43_P127112 [Bacillus thuringiensis serovar chinensis CT-43]AGG04818.1 hypothetical protein H175_107p094 [Bacillus thuringiensis serovar thuringiensis str. IS5056]AHZ55226.1 hypothetical protein YBT1520_33151 [Bacillus thuringiensis serovar kurstaki str. YBT-1520]AIM34447.1 hypothetical protein DF16_pBMB95orf00034 [Bacillus thuringiensi